MKGLICYFFGHDWRVTMRDRNHFEYFECKRCGLRVGERG